MKVFRDRRYFFRSNDSILRQFVVFERQIKVLEGR